MSEFTPGQLREAVREAEGRGASRNELARRCGVSAGSLSRFMAGKTRPSLLFAIKVASGTGKAICLVDRTPAAATVEGAAPAEVVIGTPGTAADQQA